MSLLGCHNQTPQTGSLNNRNVFSPHSGDCKSSIRVLASLVSLEASLLGLQMPTLLFPLHMVVTLCLCIPGISSSSY